MSTSSRETRHASWDGGDGSTAAIRILPDALMVLDQPWPVENAVVDIPFPPGRMAPVSGVHVCLLYRMLDEAIAERLASTP